MSFYKNCCTAVIIFGLAAENNLVSFLMAFLKQELSDHLLSRLQNIGNIIVRCDSTATIIMADDIIASVKSMRKFPFTLMRTKFNLQL